MAAVTMLSICTVAAGTWFSINVGGSALFAPKLAKPQTKVAAASTSRLAPHRSTLVGYRLSHDPFEQATLGPVPGPNSTPLGNGRNCGDEQRRIGDIGPIETAPRGVSWDFSKLSLFPPVQGSRARSLFPPAVTPICGAIQAKLVVGQANDPLENEADRIADELMRKPEPQISSRATPPPVSRKCAACEKEDTEAALQTKAAESFEASAVPFEMLRSLGRPLEPQTRAFFEPRFGRDFSAVRIHADDQAAGSARTLGALAYTVGPHIFFGRGQYQPGSAAGRHLIAHELTHSIQQSGLPPTAASAQRQTSPGQTPPGQTPPGQTPGPPPSPCDQMIRVMTTEALRWLDDDYTQLLNYEADEVYAVTGAPPTPDHQRITGSLRESFHTNDTGYVSVIRQRLLHVANMLRQPGAVTFTCGGPHCSGAGGSFTAAYVERPYALTMCSTAGTPSDSDVRTFIHEMIHAVVPQVGIRNRVKAGTGVIDRAYLQERVFRFLSPDEALDNAESYALLSDQLFHRSTTSGVSAPTDTTTGCKDPNPVIEAFARADQWNRSAHLWVQAVVAHLRSNGLRGVSDLAAADAEPFTRFLPSLTSAADLAALEGAYESLQSNGFFNPWDFGCVTGSPGCSGGALAFSDTGSASATSITPRRITTRNTVGICPSFLTASLADRTRSVYAAFLISRPSWIIAGFRLADKLPYIDFAQHIANRRAPAPAVKGALAHELANAPPLQAPTRRP
jgi:Domain of unknown function (DUF4157)